MAISTKTNALVVLVHGYALTTSQYASVKATIEKELPDAHVILPTLPLQTFSAADLNDVVKLLMQHIDDAWSKIAAITNASPCKIVLIGHSTGALIARKIYISACGENADAPFERGVDKQPRPWASAVERLILLAGISRGWTINPHMNLRRLIAIRVGMVLGSIMQLFGKTPIIFRTRRGASFVTQVRMQWLSMLKHVANKEVGGALVVQLLGTVDDLISPNEVIDLVTGSNFIYLDIPNSGHVNVLNLDEPGPGPGRKAVFIDALTKNKSELEQIQITPDDDTLIRTDADVTDVVFVIHGIRDTGYWTQKLARRVKAEGDKTQVVIDGQVRKRKFAMETSTYGYFAMLPFILYSTRRAKVEWLMDQYVENKARYPNATFSFIGHSNGTYLLAKALHDYPACTFEHVVFAGSVVSSDYNWNHAITTKRVRKIFNFVATSDLVVAIFPGSFQKFRRIGLGRDFAIGGAGFDGFSTVGKDNQLFYVEGGHGAAVKEKYWNDIAYFIVHGEFPSNNTTTTSPAIRPGKMQFFGHIGVLLFIILFAIVLLVGAVVTLAPTEMWARIAAIIGYVLVLRFIVTKF